MPNQGENVIGRRLREVREAKGLSQKGLGIAAGIDEFSASPRINQYENGVHVPDFQTVTRLAKVLKMPTIYFYSDSDEWARLIALLATLPNSKLREVEGFIKSQL